MTKWNELRDYLINSLILTEVDHKNEATKELKNILGKMDELDVKYFNKRKNKFNSLTSQDIKDSMEANKRAWKED